MPCYEPWDSWLTPGTPEYSTAKKRVEAIADSSRHAIDAYLQMHDVEPLARRRHLPFEPDDRTPRPFDLAKLSLGLIHSLAQHCLCDGVGPIELMDAASVLSETDQPDAVYRAIMLDIAHAIRLKLPFGRYDRSAYERHEWTIRGEFEP